MSRAPFAAISGPRLPLEELILPQNVAPQAHDRDLCRLESTFVGPCTVTGYYPSDRNIGDFYPEGHWIWISEPYITEGTLS
jgi:hypothetical protein